MNLGNLRDLSIKMVSEVSNHIHYGHLPMLASQQLESQSASRARFRGQVDPVTICTVHLVFRAVGGPRGTCAATAVSIFFAWAMVGVTF